VGDGVAHLDGRHADREHVWIALADEKAHEPLMI
jgi:hypothetical protein